MSDKSFHGVVMSDDIILKFSNANILVNDKVYERIKKQDNSLKFADSLIDDLTYSGENIFIVTEDILDNYLKNNNFSAISGVMYFLPKKIRCMALINS
jgi:DNA polymerase II small subunit